MSLAQTQKRIDAVSWYHEFDFGNTLKAKSNAPDIEAHRHHWGFIEEQLASISFQNQTVLDVGCWDGYWSFHAERRGARSVLATDDFSQNWAGSQGLFLAKELLKSSVEVNPRVSVYDLASLNRKFDVILVLGVYYHLWDPFHAFAQIRHCCHPKTIVIFEGNAATALPPYSVYLNSSFPTSKFTPTPEALFELLDATYFRSESHALLSPRSGTSAPIPKLGWRWRLRMCWEVLKGRRQEIKNTIDREVPPPPASANNRMVVKCAAFEGANDKHVYRPPFGLHVYDPRFAGLREAG